ncbi:hypothetical protein ACFV9W_09750 [Streptomyces sp. NPDC059897]|uniref:hypothetical protein n=1 Tax=Streptomyces sp. NPDC059897 TaxID=3346994 RepID=UPI00365C126D
MSRTHAALGAATLALVAVTGCAGAQAGTTGDTKRTAWPTDVELGTLDRAEQLLTGRCMARHEQPYRPGRAPRPDEMRTVGLVLDDVGWARRNGYGDRFDRVAERERGQDRNTAHLRGLSPEARTHWERTLFGPADSRTVSVRLPSGGRTGTSLEGCLASAREQLYGDLRAWFRASKTAQGLTPLYADKVTRDPRYTTAVGWWSRCMRGKGLSYRSPQQIRDHLPSLDASLGPDRAHRSQVRLAVAEATCARSTELAERVGALERSYREDTIGPAYRKEVDTYLRLTDEALVRARPIVRDHG